MDESWNLRDSLSARELERRQTKFRELSSAVLYWNELREYQTDGMEDLFNFCASLGVKAELMAGFAANLGEMVGTMRKPSPFSEVPLHPLSERMGVICGEKLLAVDDAYLESVRRLRGGLEHEISLMLHDMERNVARALTPVWREASALLVAAARADVRVRACYDSLMQRLLSSPGAHSTADTSIGASNASIGSPGPDDQQVDREEELVRIYLHQCRDDGAELDPPQTEAGAGVDNSGSLDMWGSLMQYFAASFRFELLLLRCQSGLARCYRRSKEIEATRQLIVIRASEKLVQLFSAAGAGLGGRAGDVFRLPRRTDLSDILVRRVGRRIIYNNANQIPTVGSPNVPFETVSASASVSVRRAGSSSDLARTDAQAAGGPVAGTILLALLQSYTSFLLRALLESPEVCRCAVMHRHATASSAPYPRSGPGDIPVPSGFFSLGGVSWVPVLVVYTCAGRILLYDVPRVSALTASGSNAPVSVAEAVAALLLFRDLDCDGLGLDDEDLCLLIARYRTGVGGGSSSTSGRAAPVTTPAPAPTVSASASTLKMTAQSVRAAAAAIWRDCISDADDTSYHKLWADLKVDSALRTEEARYMLPSYTLRRRRTALQYQPTEGRQLELELVEETPAGPQGALLGLFFAGAPNTTKVVLRPQTQEQLFDWLMIHPPIGVPSPAHETIFALHKPSSVPTATTPATTVAGLSATAAAMGGGVDATTANNTPASDSVPCAPLELSPVSYYVPYCPPPLPEVSSMPPPPLPELLGVDEEVVEAGADVGTGSARMFVDSVMPASAPTGNVGVDVSVIGSVAPELEPDSTLADMVGQVGGQQEADPDTEASGVGGVAEAPEVGSSLAEMAREMQATLAGASFDGEDLGAGCGAVDLLALSLSGEEGGDGENEVEGDSQSLSPPEAVSVSVSVVSMVGESGAVYDVPCLPSSLSGPVPASFTGLVTGVASGAPGAPVSVTTEESTTVTDTAVTDTAVTDTAVTDTAVTDTAVTDISVTDVGVTDVGVIDVGATDVGVTNVGVIDVGVTDVGVTDVGVTDVGVTTTELNSEPVEVSGETPTTAGPDEGQGGCNQQ